MPAPGVRRVKFRGDTVSFALDIGSNHPGSAWIRTTLGHAETSREEIRKAVLSDAPPLGRAWYDIPMTRISPEKFEITLALCEIGHFEAKCYFIPEGKTTPVWPEGDNVILNVEPADMCCANIIYNAFVRQFGPNKSGACLIGDRHGDSIQNLDQEGYTVIPPSGTFRDLIGELDFIIHTLGCRILHLLPINPTPTTYGRMGRFGSPYAALDFTGIDPGLAVFDPTATPLEQFIELVDAVHARHAKIIIDLAPNHTGWAAELHETHPEWLVRDENGEIQAPGAWGVVWADLTRLDYNNKDLWKYMADVFLLWCVRGVDGFRCDAGYMIPIPAWNFIVATVREQFPETIFFLEGLGGKISVTREILSLSNFNWAYSELFQNYHPPQIETYLSLADRISAEDGLMIHFAETHDNNRLAATSPAYAAMRTALCALLSNCGGFGFANGVEWFATEKINVHDACSLNWGADMNQVDRIQRLNLLLKCHPAFFDQTEMKTVRHGDGNYIAVLRHHLPSRKRLLVLINLDTDHPATAEWEACHFPLPEGAADDLLSGREIAIEAEDGIARCHLGPAEALCLSPGPDNISHCVTGKDHAHLPDRIHEQCLRAMALEMHRFFIGSIKLTHFDVAEATQQLARDPEKFCRTLNPYSEESRVVLWRWPADARRQVMIPPDHLLMVCADTPFKARIVCPAGPNQSETEITLASAPSLLRDDGSSFALFPLRTDKKTPLSATLKLSVFQDKNAFHAAAPLLYLAAHKNITARCGFHRKHILAGPLRHLGTNGRGAMMRANARWGELESRYDALLSANLNPDFPDNRWMMLIRCRAWIVFQGFSQEISTDCLTRFYVDHETGCRWEFTVPTGQGQHIILAITAAMLTDRNQIRLSFNRRAAKDKSGVLPDHQPVRLIVRPDIDDRDFHANTKAYIGPEHTWPAAINPMSEGFFFAPHPERKLMMTASAGVFVGEPEWQYMIFLPTDAKRGMDPHTDLFSPGYFSGFLNGSDTFILSAAVLSPGYTAVPGFTTETADAETARFILPRHQNLEETMRRAVRKFLVRRNSHQTVIAGYPWFLDWGRDTLIACRGLIAAGFISETRSILKQFAQFEDHGTIPNVIFGSDTRNRDTSDAPLWLIAACRDMFQQTEDTQLLDEPCGDRPLRKVLRSIVEHYMTGTPNGIVMDPDTALIYSPSHFTWMDTNFPAGTPRQGYPIEIQALWHYALSFMAQIDDSRRNTQWTQLADRVSRSIRDLFYRKTDGYLADCLHAAPGTGAKNADRDDALRPNQLFAITLGAISDPDIMEKTVHQCGSLVVPGAIRSLADRPVKRPLEIMHNGRMLNDPNYPYQGIYTGDEDTRRKPAYHNGTAWTWVFPSFCEAWPMVFGNHAKDTARAILASSAHILNTGCAGQVPEILDGNYPHPQRGCDAQAWGASEWLRVWIHLSR